jgi:O-antigen biosynthesis alpha-1,2-rhamnosyltransferase
MRHTPSTGRRSPERIFIDASYTLFSGKSSGIERVVRSIIRESRHLEMKVQPQVVFCHNGRFFPVDEQQIGMLGKPAKMKASLLNHLPRSYHYLASTLCNYWGGKKLRRLLLPENGHLGIFKVVHSLYERIVSAGVVNQSDPIEPTENDLFLMPDAYWPKRGVWSAVEHAREHGAMIATLLYDLIPLTHPEFVGQRRRDTFINYLKQLGVKSDLIIAISDTVRDQVAKTLPELCENQSICSDIRHFELGAELTDLNGEVRENVISLFGPTEKQSPYLMVATFDPRKNHRYLLQAFDRLWSKRPDIKLCLAGRIGWMCDDILTQLEVHPLRDRNLFVFHDLTDAELQYCYASTRGVIFPSIVEGFGLPIVESLWHGTKTFASDTPIHREVGRGDCSYFDLDDPDSLVASILDWESQLAVNRPTLPVRRPIQWSESNRQLLSHCFDAFQKKSQPSIRKVA